jgi:glycosyltransferase involved in cell wall biosynthesis
MKVLFTIDSLAQGGTEQSLAELIPHLGKDVEIVIVYFYDAHALREIFLSLRCRLYYMEIAEKYGFIQAVSKLKEIVKEEKPDIIVGSLYRSLIISRLVSWLTRVPMVGTFVNERYGFEQKERFKGIAVCKYYMTWLMDRLTAFIPMKIISNSYSIAVSNAAALNINHRKIKVIYRGRDTAQIKHWQKRDHSDGFTWMAIGRLIPQKGYDILLTAVSSLVIKYPGVRLRILGEGPLKEDLQNKIYQLGLESNIFLLGNVPSAREYLYEADAYVLPSISEGFSGALVEALITGIPFVASDIPMNLEAISPGRLSFIFRSGDADSLAKEMDKLMSQYDEACRIGAIARNRASDYYDIKNIASDYEATLREVLNGKKT